jgi:hypothetical protein
MARFTDEEKSYFQKTVCEIFWGLDPKHRDNGTTYVRLREVLRAENTRRRANGLVEFEEPSLDTVGRILTRSVPPDQMKGRQRKLK